MEIKNAIRHELVNNMIRIDILNKLLIENIDKNQSINTEYQHDLLEALTEQIEIVKALKQI